MPLMPRTVLSAPGMLAASCVLTLATAFAWGAGQHRALDLDRQFQSAVALYQNKQYDQAEQILSSLLHRVPDDYQVNELMGMVCAARSKEKQAIAYLRNAVRLKPVA